jgi:hypothetical protein
MACVSAHRLPVLSPAWRHSRWSCGRSAVLSRVIRVVELFLLGTVVRWILAVASPTSTACTDLITVNLNDRSAYRIWWHWWAGAHLKPDRGKNTFAASFAVSTNKKPHCDVRGHLQTARSRGSTQDVCIHDYPQLCSSNMRVQHQV